MLITISTYEKCMTLKKYEKIADNVIMSVRVADQSGASLHLMSMQTYTKDFIFNVITFHFNVL